MSAPAERSAAQRGLAQVLEEIQKWANELAEQDHECGDDHSVLIGYMEATIRSYTKLTS